MRLFIATSFPEAVTRELNSRVAAVKPRLPSASWVRPESQHLTFAFLGEQDESLIDKLAPPLETRLHDFKRFEAVVHGCGFFPNPRHARVGWVGLEPEQPFNDIAAAVREVVTNNGIELDRVDFRPHLTLMRIRDRWPPASIETFEKGLRDYRSAPFAVDAVTLYSSRLNPSGAVHTPVRRLPLA
ncbi:MAG TPA: RNA 2',3'-cyclic phosphodiesterase [Thermoanaerobaculia bacterium]|nr:RNA 2',3'-cyclic phosphodiesterase [Thermoanaerobaculia bacterium]